MIERVDPGDALRLDRLAALHAAAFADSSRGWSAAEIGSLAANGVLLAEDADQGFALVSLAADEAELLTIAVAPTSRRRGLGGRLLSHAIDAARAAGAIAMHLEVADDNAAARRLYESQEFAQVARRPGYYRRGAQRVDALMFTKALRVSPDQQSL